MEGLGDEYLFSSPSRQNNLNLTSRKKQIISNHSGSGVGSGGGGRDEGKDNSSLFTKEEVADMHHGSNDWQNIQVMIHCRCLLHQYFLLTSLLVHSNRKEA